MLWIHFIQHIEISILQLVNQFFPVNRLTYSHTRSFNWISHDFANVIIIPVFRHWSLNSRVIPIDLRERVAILGHDILRITNGKVHADCCNDGFLSNAFICMNECLRTRYVYPTRVTSMQIHSRDEQVLLQHAYTRRAFRPAYAYAHVSLSSVMQIHRFRVHTLSTAPLRRFFTIFLDIRAKFASTFCWINRTAFQPLEGSYFAYLQYFLRMYLGNEIHVPSGR